MAENSKRERIILADISLIEELVPDTFKTVSRQLQSYSDLQEFAVTQLPVVAVVGRMPVPVNHKYTGSGQVDFHVSRLRVDFFCYIQDNVNPDVTVSNLLDDLWAKLYSNPTRNNLCMHTELTADEDLSYWKPYVAFLVSAFHTYQHTTEGI